MVSDKDGMTLVYVPAGEFLMGATDAEVAQALKDCSGSGFPECDLINSEKPQHTVSLDAYWIDKTDVTNAMFAQFVQATGYKTNAEKQGYAYVLNLSKGLSNGISAELWEPIPGANWQHPRGPGSDIKGLDDHPVVQVSWNEAKAYCEWAGRQLPTEAQWEKAARGPDGRKYPWGNDPVAGNLLNFADKNLAVSWADKTIDDGYQFTSPVGHYPKGASPYGVLDMAGNVDQWVADWYDEKYYASSPAQNPPGPASGQNRVERGGAYLGSTWNFRTAYRDWEVPEFGLDFLGFRCVRSP
jgi:serine/threonine-protein kinase